MSDTFTASNGRQITCDPKLDETRVVENGQNMLENFDFLNDRDMKALREFFQHERDKELGRWRWPDNPDYVIYRMVTSAGVETESVRVFSESTGVSMGPFSQLTVSGGVTGDAARAYFAAHSEPKPWHDARDGQLWLIRFSDFPNTDVSALVKGGRFIYNDDCHEGTATLKDSSIVRGKQIWPEVPSE